MSAFPTLITTTKVYLGITTTATDVLIQLFTDLVVAEIEAEIGDKLSQVTITDEELHFLESQNFADDMGAIDQNNPYPILSTKYSPVSSLSVSHQQVSVSTANYNYNSNGVITMFAFYDDSKNELKATYTAGYSTLPSDLQMIVFEGVKTNFMNSGTTKQNSGNISSKKLADFSVSYGDSQTGLYNDNGKKSYICNNMSILQRYQRISI